MRRCQTLIHSYRKQSWAHVYLRAGRVCQHYVAGLRISANHVIRLAVYWKSGLVAPTRTQNLWSTLPAAEFVIHPLERHENACFEVTRDCKRSRQRRQQLTQLPSTRSQQ